MKIQINVSIYHRIKLVAPGAIKPLQNNNDDKLHWCQRRIIGQLHIYSMMALWHWCGVSVLSKDTSTFMETRLCEGCNMKATL